MPDDIFRISRFYLDVLVDQANSRKISNEVVVNRWQYEKIVKALKLGELYKEFFDNLNPTIEIEYDSTDSFDGVIGFDVEEMDINSPDEETIEIYKKIKELEK